MHSCANSYDPTGPLILLAILFAFVLLGLFWIESKLGARVQDAEALVDESGAFNSASSRLRD
jgi:hypothetical protein